MTNYFCKAESKCIIKEYYDGSDYVKCIFENVNANNTEPLFYPTADNPMKVVQVELSNSKITTLTSELCVAFPNIQKLSMQRLLLKNIEEGALDQCIHMTYINFRDNELIEIPEKLFQRNLKLEFIDFNSNKITNFNPNILLNLDEIESLEISNNYITNLDLKNFPVLVQLYRLDISNNELTDLDEEEMMLKFPSLNTLFLKGNPFDCNRLRRIIENLEEKNVGISRMLYSKKNRSYSPEFIGYTECLPIQEQIRLFGPLNPVKTKNQIKELKGII